jgi:hypothetical protein
MLYVGAPPQIPWLYLIDKAVLAVTAECGL